MNFDRGVDPRHVRTVRWMVVAAAAALCAFAAASAQAASVQPLEIVTRTACRFSSVEMATTEQEKETGLMYRKELPDGKGMLFRFLAGAAGVDVDEKYLHSARHDLHPGRRPDPADCGKYGAAIDQDHPVGGAGEGVLEVIAGTAKSTGSRPRPRGASAL